MPFVVVVIIIISTTYPFGMWWHSKSESFGRMVLSNQVEGGKKDILIGMLIMIASLMK